MAKKKKSGIALIAAAVAAVILAAIALGWVLGSRGEDDPPVATRGTSGGPTSSSGQNVQTDGICGLPVGSQEVPEVGPEATWELKAGSTIPSSKEYGPGIVEDGNRSCFAHNPMGAVFFSLNLPALDPEHWEEHIKGPVPEKPESESGSLAPNTVLTVRGFKVETPTPDRAVVTVAYEVSGQPGYQSGTWVHEWVDGDWKWVSDDPANTADKFEPLTSLDGYTTWGPQ